MILMVILMMFLGMVIGVMGGDGYSLVGYSSAGYGNDSCYSGRMVLRL